MDEVTRAPELAALAGVRTLLLVDSVRHLGIEQLGAPSALDGWSRLTILCHLRYGASALARMTRDTLAGEKTSYYPDGRSRQRSGTLVPANGEAADDVIDSLYAAGTELDGEWARLRPDDWSREITEPADNRDLGRVSLARLALSRLLEIDVHGTDLAIGFPDWSPALVEVALPTRLSWLSTRRTNHRAFDRTLRGSWLLVATDGPTWFVAVDAERVESRPAVDADAPTATLEGSARDLLALLLGRPRLDELSVGGDTAFGLAFSRAFPGP
jgi:uncharacterized protein (TIGR03083 family)